MDGTCKTFLIEGSQENWRERAFDPGQLSDFGQKAGGGEAIPPYIGNRGNDYT